MVEGTYQRLAARFPAEAHKTRKQGGRDLTYLTGEQVVSRLNDVLGVAGWSFTVTREGQSGAEAWVLGQLTATIDGVMVMREQYGNQELMRGQHATTDLYKSAATDALKKCASLLGVGLYLYDEDERREVEQEMREAKRNPKPTAPSAPVAAAAAMTGAPVPIDTARQKLVADLEKGIKFAKSIGLTPAIGDITAMSNGDIEQTLAGLRQQCVEQRKKMKAQAS